MKKKRWMAILVLVLCMSGMGQNKMLVQAEEMGEDIEFSYLLTDSTLVGNAVLQTRGLYLLSGDSVINKISSTKIGAGGTTTTAIKCKVSVTSIVERKSASGSWVRVTSWTNTVESGYTATVSKSLTVGTGYYYRVRSTHYASTDSSSSYTSALKM